MINVFIEYLCSLDWRGVPTRLVLLGAAEEAYVLALETDRGRAFDWLSVAAYGHLWGRNWCGVGPPAVTERIGRIRFPSQVSYGSPCSPTAIAQSRMVCV